MDDQGGWALEVDIQQFYDTLDRTHPRRFLQHRVRDGVIERLIGKWLKAGVLEAGSISYPAAGTPQGGVISPLLSNVYLHYVLDVWFEQEIRPLLRGKAAPLRYAEDALLTFEREDDAKRVMDVLPKRFAKYGLRLHPDKTRLLPFHRPAPRATGKGDGSGCRPMCFDLLGFAHYWARSRKGYWVVKRKTASNRLSRAVQRISDWCRRHRHLPLRVQALILRRKLWGHYAYYRITGNSAALSRFKHAVDCQWRHWLSRRTSSRLIPWDRFERIRARFPLPPPRVVHSVYPRAANP
jgi:RNA-directed DNA polymerase